MTAPPFDAAITAATRLLVVAPHPDDETLASGVLMQRVLAAGGSVDVLLLTAGDNNPWPQRLLERRWHIGTAGRARWAHRRQGEIRSALKCLGVDADSLHELGWPDLGLVDLALQPAGQTLRILGDRLASLQPTLLALPALTDRHPDHAAAHVLVRLALAARNQSPQLWSYLVHGSAAPAHGVTLHANPREQALKLSALAAHTSQITFSGPRLRRMASGPEHFGDALDVCADGWMPWRPPAWLAPLLWLSVIGPDGVHEWRWSDAPLQRHADGRSRLVSTAAGIGEPRFARLALRIPSPWIFDHWGWCQIA